MRITQGQLAVAAGVPLPSHKNYEGSVSIPGGEAIGGYLRAGINPIWLLSGDGPMLLSELKQPVSPLDAGLLIDVIEAVEQHLAEIERELSPAKKVKLIELLYRSFMEAAVKPPRAVILKLVRELRA